MNINEAFPSKYLKATDLKGRKIKVTIDQVTTEKMGDDTKPVLYFEGKEKGMVLNRTNGMLIASYFGPETAEWKGRQITLYATKTSMQGQMVDALRVEIVPEVSADEQPNF